MVLIVCPQRRPIVQQFSYTGRSVILKIAERLTTASQICDDELLRRVSAFLLSHHTHAGFVHALTEYAIIVSNHWRVSTMPEVKTTARFAPRYFLQEDKFLRNTMRVAVLQDEAYVLSPTLLEIAGLTGYFARSARFSLAALAGQLMSPSVRLATFVAIRAIGSLRLCSSLEQGPQSIARIIAAILAGVN